MAPPSDPRWGSLSAGGDGGGGAPECVHVLSEHGEWVITMPETGRLWRVLVDDDTKSNWRLNELEFYSHHRCFGDTLLYDYPIGMSLRRL